MDVKQKGKLGESLTVSYLKNKNIDVITTNYHSRHGEIDIVAKDEKFIIFIEVKLRKKNSLVCPGEAVNRAKQQKIIKTAYDYLLKNDFKLQPRFDVSEVELINDKSFKINYIKNAFWQNEEYSIF